MSEPGAELTPLPEPLDDDQKSARSPFVALGVAAVVVSTVFATVATLASSRDEQAAPPPPSDGVVETSTTESYTTEPTMTSAPPSSTTKPPKSSSSSTTASTTTEDEETTPADEPTGGNTSTKPGTTTPRPPTTTNPPPNRVPVADFTFSCTDLACDFDGSGSQDPDGSIASYSWSFGGSDVTASHTFETAGTYNVTLTVTDNKGKTSAKTKQVTVPAPPTT